MVGTLGTKGVRCCAAATIALALACTGDDGSSGLVAVTTAAGGGGVTTTGGGGSSSGAVSADNATQTDAGSDTGGLDESSDDGQVMGECILWGNECTAGSQKCMPWSLLADRIPDEIRCCALADNPKQENESCTVEEYDGSCRDDCREGTMCIVDDLKTLSGVCRQFCDPSLAGSACDPDDTCKPFFETLRSAPQVPLCMDKCDPLVQDCVQPGWLCLPDSPTVAGQSGFICTPPAPGTLNGPLTACGFANDCQAGLGCIVADRLPDCPFTTCCTAFCSLSEGDAACIALDPLLRCIDWMSLDPDWQDVGVCALPE